MLKHLRNQKGSVLIVTILALDLSLLLLTMVLDLANVWMVREKLQSMLDASTLAAVQCEDARQVKINTKLVPQSTTTRTLYPWQFPPNDMIVSYTKEWDYRIVMIEVTDHLTGEKKMVPYEEPYWTGRYHVTYVTEWREEVVGYTAQIEEWAASAAAMETFNANLANDSIMRKAIILDIDEEPQQGQNFIGYRMTARAYVPSTLLGPIIRFVTRGQSELNGFTLRVESESKAFLGP